MRETFSKQNMNIMFLLKSKNSCSEGDLDNTTLQKLIKEFQFESSCIWFSFNLSFVGLAKKPGRGFLFIFTGYYTLCVEIPELLYLFNELFVIYQWYYLSALLTCYLICEYWTEPAKVVGKSRGKQAPGGLEI